MIPRLLTAALLTAAVAANAPLAQRGDSAAALLRQAADAETVDGDLTRAMQLYQAVVDRYAATDRRAAAEALLKLAQGYERTAGRQRRQPPYGSFEGLARGWAGPRTTRAKARKSSRWSVTIDRTTSRFSR
jgi:hypothetical protein